jgi:hypothetical protein
VTADEHIAEAERLLGLNILPTTVAAAQVHATLAVAQATIAANRLRPGPTVSPR